MSEKRRTFQGVKQILGYNWPFYAASLGLIAATKLALKLCKWPPWIEIPAKLGYLSAIWWTAASLFASWWVYDCSDLMNWRWLSEIFPAKPQNWANIHCGLDESTPSLRALFPDTNGVVLDIFDADEMTEPAIRRARVEGATQQADYRNLPLQNESQDAVFLFFAAHELRKSASRATFWREIGRVLRPGGRVVLVEHSRDFANFLAFGPGFSHFWPRGEWRRLSKIADLRIAREMAFTPFVRVWVLDKNANNSGRNLH